MTISRGTFLKGASFTALAGLLAACSTGNGSSTTGSTASVSAEAGAFPITITSDYGDTVIKQAPTKIAVVNAWKNADALLALGVVPAGIPKISWGQNSNDSTDWFDAKLKEMGKSLNGYHPLRRGRRPRLPGTRQARSGCYLRTLRQHERRNLQEALRHCTRRDRTQGCGYVRGIVATSR